MEKKNKGLVIGLVISIIFVIGLSGYFVYNKVFSKNDNVNNNEKSNSENEGNSSELIKNGTELYEDDNYVTYEKESGWQHLQKEYLVYDKINKNYINDKYDSENSKISYFGNISGKYYYFVFSYVNDSTPKTDIYEIGTDKPLKSFLAAYTGFNEATELFTFDETMTSTGSFYMWSPNSNFIDNIILKNEFETVIGNALPKILIGKYVNNDKSYFVLQNGNLKLVEATGDMNQDVETYSNKDIKLNISYGSDGEKVNIDFTINNTGKKYTYEGIKENSEYVFRATSVNPAGGEGTSDNPYPYMLVK